MVSVTSVLPPKFDVFDPRLHEDPYPVYARLRSASPVCRAGPASLAIPRYHEVSALLRDPRLGHRMPGRDLLLSRLPEDARPNTELTTIVSSLDTTQHLRVRRLLARAMTPQFVARIRRQARPAVAALMADALAAGVFDAVADLALPLVTAVACDMLGVAAQDRAEVTTQAVALGRAIILAPFVTPERGNGAREARWMRAYAWRLIEERRADPDDGLVSRLIAARHEGDRLSDRELVDNVVFLFFAGFESTVHVIAGGTRALAERPDQYALLRADPTLAAGAVEEVLRLDAPLQWVSRMTAEPVEVGDRVVRAGRVLLLLLGSANRDERQFAAADRLDVTRDPNPQLGFGAGVHRCLGVNLARAIGSLVFEQLAGAAHELAVAGPARRRRHPNLRGYLSAPISARSAAARSPR